MLNHLALKTTLPSPRRMAGSQRGHHHSRAPSVVAVNNNVSWLSAPGVWTSYVVALLALWLALCAVCSPSRAWDILLLAHFCVTFPLFHWHKGSPIASDQGAYDKLTFWEQMDEGVQLTRNKKFFTAIPVALFLPSWQRGEHATPLGLASLAATVVLVLAKTPFMHRVRLFGINA